MSVQKLAPPFTEETAKLKVQRAQDLWNTKDAEKVALAYTPDSEYVYILKTLKQMNSKIQIYSNYLCINSIILFIDGGIGTRSLKEETLLLPS
jgi:nuclear transport factor 2 (NTF2) superfamily protein